MKNLIVNRETYCSVEAEDDPVERCRIAGWDYHKCLIRPCVPGLVGPEERKPQPGLVGERGEK